MGKKRKREAMKKKRGFQSEAPDLSREQLLSFIEQKTDRSS